MAVFKKDDFIRQGQPYRAKSGKYAGKTRFEIVELMIKNKERFVEGATSSGRKLEGMSVVSKKGEWPCVIKVKSDTGNKSEEISLTKVYKSPLFGGGGGSGGGAAVTAVTESGQCYYCSLAFNVVRGPIKLEHCTDENFTKAARYVQATVSYKAFKDRVPSDWIESGTFIKTANIVYKKYSSKISGATYFHRGSPFMAKVYAAKKEVVRLDKAMAQKDGRAPAAPGSFSDDKWNPGDIWMTTMSPGADPLMQFKKDWGVLNQAVLDKAGRLNTPRTFLLGISLKKLGSTVKLEEYNAPDRVKLVSHPFKRFVFGRNNDFFSSIDMYMYIGQANVQFRAFNSTSSWQGEIKGLSAAGGKIGGGNLNFYCEKHIRKSIGQQGIMNGWRETPSNQVKLNDMYYLYKKYAKNPCDVKQFIKQCLEKGGSFIFSKNMCLLFLDTMMSATSTQRNKVCTDIIKYAASSTDLSSFYVKVS
tara:strand:+ start:255 stop:1673 length:1419 start_codon:yes stop_codon:yes gene_type:complete